MVLCPSCGKAVFFAERQLYNQKEYHQICYNILIKQENASKPKTFAIHEQIFCNVEENSKFKYPLAPAGGYYVPDAKTINCTKCSKEAKPTDKFCTSCGNKLVV
ncbi:hypothetical protein RB653_000032 [Dictyostelium firmibasis]|uniref:Uncharacterized protein n=1 Tax=Dictyostelium firmibasis TaxID=79012 RepID=A0AAN7U6I8_9MYCE